MIFCHEGRTGFLELDSGEQCRNNLNLPRVVLFLVFNCLVNVSHYYYYYYYYYYILHYYYCYNACCCVLLNFRTVLSCVQQPVNV